MGVTQTSRRIGLDLPMSLLDRVDRQAVLTNMSRRTLMLAAVEGLCNDFEQIDAECGIVCPDCGGPTDVDMFADGRHRVCLRCMWRFPE